MSWIEKNLYWIKTWNSKKILLGFLVFLVLWMLSGLIVKSKGESDVIVGTNHTFYKIEKKVVKMYSHPLKSFGIAFAKNKVTLASQIAGKVIKVHVNSGDYLKKGDLIVSIDSKNFKENVLTAQSTLNKSLLIKDAAQNLYRSGLGSKLDIEQNEENVRRAYAAFIDAKKNFGYTEIRAPFDGNIDNITVRDGDLLEYVTTGTNVIGEFYDMQNMEAHFFLSFRDINKITKNTLVDLYLIDEFSEDKNRKKVRGRIIFISNVMDKNTNAYLVKVVAKEPIPSIKQGRDIGGTFLLEAERGVMIPKSSLVIDSDGKIKIKIVKDNKIFDFDADILFDDNDLVCVKYELTDSVDVVISGADYLIKGDIVKY